MPENAWTHLVRFKLEDGTYTFAQLCELPEDGRLKEYFKVNIASGDPVLGNIKQTGEVVTVARKALVSPVATCPIVSVIGINYNTHLKETNQSALRPTVPVVFYKPFRSLAEPYAEIRAHKLAQEHLDYEGELVFQTGCNPAKDVSKEDASQYILAYTTGLDLTARDGKVLRPMNFCFGKSFDHFSPVGPILVHSSVLGFEPKLSLRTKLNGETVQTGNTGDMLFKCAEILSAMSSGTTIEPGTIIFTGTPGGSAHFEGGTGKYITSGDNLEVEIERIGNLSVHVGFD